MTFYTIDQSRAAVRVRFDPCRYLPASVVTAVFDCLSEGDLVRSRRVSHLWRDHIDDYLSHPAAGPKTLSSAFHRIDEHTIACLTCDRFHFNNHKLVERGLSAFSVGAVSEARIEATPEARGSTASLGARPVSPEQGERPESPPLRDAPSAPLLLRSSSPSSSASGDRVGTEELAAAEATIERLQATVQELQVGVVAVDFVAVERCRAIQNNPHPRIPLTHQNNNRVTYATGMRRWWPQWQRRSAFSTTRRGWRARRPTWSGRFSSWTRTVTRRTAALRPRRRRRYLPEGGPASSSRPGRRSQFTSPTCRCAPLSGGGAAGCADISTHARVVGC